MFKNLILIVSILSSLITKSQEVDEHLNNLKLKDSLCLKDCLLHAHWEAHARTFAMSTINEGSLKDDYAIGSGAGIGVVTKPLYGFQIGVSGFFMYNLISSNIQLLDSQTNLSNRYEIGLFDIENPTNKNDLDRLEELYLKYTISKTSVTIGKLNLNTPFFNPQDGRMRPTVEEGIWMSMKEWNKIGINGGWIWDVSPRSTVKWFSVANSMGVYSMGVNETGIKSNYHTNIEGNSGIGIMNVYYKPSNNIKLNFWNAFLENVMNTAVVEVNTEQSNENLKFYEGIIYLHQDAINNGGNSKQSQTYIHKGAQSNAVSTQVGVNYQNTNTNINYTHITGDGRYLMPREWGKEIFYTFLPRERNEGLGNVHAFSIKTSCQLMKQTFKMGLGYGYYLLPDVKNYRLNKYGLPSYHQINLDASYNFVGFLKGLEVKCLVACKLKQGETYQNAKYIYNKVNMVNLNLIFDFKL